jgi:flagellar basal-body rod protein FlgB
MDLTKLTLLRGLQDKMGWLTQRQAVLSQNIANADTPGYSAQDLKPFSFEAAMKAVPMSTAATQPMHFVKAGAARSSIKSMAERRPFEVAPAGNGVVLEEQVTKATETAIEYQHITNLYRKSVNLLRTAIGRGGAA